MMRVIVVLSCLFGMSVAQGYNCAACLCSSGNTREDALGCLGFCDADGADQDGLITQDELTDVFNGWGPTSGCCDQACFLAAHTIFPACDNEKISLFEYFASLNGGDGTTICNPPFVDGWWAALGGPASGTVDGAGYQAWWNSVYEQWNDEANCGVPCP